MFRESFSIILPVYKNDIDFLLSKSIRSLFMGSIVPTTIIIVVDGPIPHQLDNIIKHYADRYSKIISVRRLEKNIGLAKALNFALQYVDTEWVLRLDADDFNHIDRFEITEQYITKHPEIVLFGGSIIEQDFNGNFISRREMPTEIDEIRRFSKLRNPFNHMTVAFKTEVVKKLGGYPNIPFREDYALWLQILNNSDQCINTKKVLVYATTGKDMIDRRGGYINLIAEYRFQKFLLSHKLKSTFAAFFHGFVRSLFILSPHNMKKFFYYRFFRKRTKI